ncbi:hypothetical protein DVH24_021771 [Malus domestica]|uniref:Uncharacterized protein n=1 Tax=Malus domestica TaxID=3750 RepID=A0A498IST7_MALDO|nr:hypothetical protein DVH24_021771 [Malus domestica]
MINGEEVIDASLDSYIYDIIRLLASQLQERSNNMAAHAVASHAISFDSAFMQDVIGPEFLFNILAEDITMPIRI